VHKALGLESRWRVCLLRAAVPCPSMQLHSAVVLCNTVTNSVLQAQSQGDSSLILYSRSLVTGVGVHHCAHNTTQNKEGTHSNLGLSGCCVIAGAGVKEESCLMEGRQACRLCDVSCD
jgi:hypothetical protein